MRKVFENLLPLAAGVATCDFLVDGDLLELSPLGPMEFLKEEQSAYLECFFEFLEKNHLETHGKDLRFVIQLLPRD